MRPVLFGPAYSVYVRAVRIVLFEKGVSHDHVDFDVFDRNDWPGDWLERQPFEPGAGLRTARSSGSMKRGAITRYIDEGFLGPPLQPGSARERARMEQVISVLDGQSYWPTWCVRSSYSGSNGSGAARPTRR